jgi:hypothetical protein
MADKPTLKGYFKKSPVPTEKEWVLTTNPGTEIEITAKGDIVVGGTYGDTTVLPTGADGQILALADGAPTWVTDPPDFVNPMTTPGDLIVGGTAGALNRLAVGTDGQILTSTGTTANWETLVISSDADTLDGHHASDFIVDVLDNNGDLLYRQSTLNQEHESSELISGLFASETVPSGMDLTVGILGNSTIDIDIWLSRNSGWNNSGFVVLLRRDNLSGTILWNSGNVLPNMGSDGSGHVVHVVKNYVDQSPTTGHYVVTFTGSSDCYAYSNYRYFRVHSGENSLSALPIGSTGQVLTVSNNGLPSWSTPISGVTSISGTAPIVSSGGLTPAISISAATTLAAGSMSASDKTKMDAISGTNTGDNAVNSLYSGLVSNASHTGDVTGSSALTIANKVTMTGTAPVSLTGSPTVIATSPVAISISPASSGVDGYMTGTNATKLDSIASGAQVNILEGISGTAPISASSISSKSQTISISAATTSAAGSMSANDKTKLDAIAGTNTGDISLSSNITSVLDLTGQALSLDTQSANTAFMGPASGSAAPTFRNLVVGDIPSLSYLPLTAVNAASHYTGFPNRTDTALSWNDGTYTLSLTATAATIWIAGVPYIINTLTKQLSVAQEAVSGLYWFWLSAPGGVPQLNVDTIAPGFDKCFVANVYWNTTINKGLLGEERHWMGRDPWMHEYLHETIGACYSGGLTGTFGNTTFAVTAGEMYDEDIEHQMSGDTPMAYPGTDITRCQVLYHNGDAAWAWDANSITPYKITTGNLRFNTGNTLSTAGINKFVNYFVYASNSSVTSPLYVIVGTAEYAKLVDATAAPIPSFGALPSAEIKLLYKITYKNDTPSFQSVIDYRGTSNLPTSNFVPTSHGSLSGLSVDDHAQYWLSGSTGRTSNFLTTGTLGAGDITGTSFNKVAITAPATSATLTILNGKTLSVPLDASVSGTNTGDVTLTATNNGLSLTNQVLSLGTPSTLTSTTTNAISGSGHTHAITAGIGLIGNGSAQYQLPVTGSTPFSPVWTTATGSGSPVLANSPTLTSPNIGTATGSASLNVLKSGDTMTGALIIQSSGAEIITAKDTSATGYSGVTLSGTGTQKYSLLMGGSSEAVFGIANKLAIYDSLTSKVRVVVDTNGYLGINTTTPGARLTVSDNTVYVAPPSGTNLHIQGADAGQARLTLDAFGNTPHLILRRAAGTSAAQTALTSGTIIGQIGAFGTYDVNTYAMSARATIVFQTAENWSSTGHGTQILFTTTNIGTVGGTTKLFIANDGRIGIGIATTNPGVALEIKGAYQTVNAPFIALTRTDSIASYGGVDWYASGGTKIWGVDSNVTVGACLEFNEASTNRMVIMPGGNIGIANTNPQDMLQVGNGASSTVRRAICIGDSFILTLQNYTGDSGSSAIMHNAYIVGGNGSSEVYTWNNSHASFGSRGISFDYTRGISFYADNAASTSGTSFTPTTRMRIANTGHISINTTSTDSILTLGNALNNWTTSSWGKALTLTNATVIKWAGNSGGYRHGIGQTTGGLYFLKSTVDDVSAAVNYTMSIADSGFVGINTTAAQSYLEVVGSPSNGSPENILTLTRVYQAGVAYTSSASFRLSNPEVGTTNTRLDISLLNTSQGGYSLPDTTVMQMFSNGSVGIGNIHKDLKLDISGAVPGGVSKLLFLENRSAFNGFWSGSGLYFGFDVSETAAGGVARIVGYTMRYNHWGSQLQLQTHTNANGDNWNVGLAIDSEGKIGLGTSSPDSMLTIKSVSADWGTQTPLHFTNADPAQGTGSLIYKMNTSSNVGGGFAFAIKNNSATTPVWSDAVMTIMNNGNIGIGNVSPKSLFHVTGTFSNFKTIEIELTDGTAKDIISDATDDIKTVGRFFYNIAPSGGMSAVYGDAVIYATNMTQYLMSTGSDEIRLTTLTSGQVYVQRTQGTRTYKIAGLVWYI